MSVPGITFGLLAGKQATGHAGELHALHAEVYAEPPYRRAGDAGEFAGRFVVQRRQPGFVLAEAWHGGYLVGYASGMPLRPSTSWWRELTAPLPDQVTAEHPGRTFALADLLVRRSWRRQGIGRALARPHPRRPPRGTGDAHCAARGCPRAARVPGLGLAQGGQDPGTRPRLARR